MKIYEKKRSGRYARTLVCVRSGRVALNDGWLGVVDEWGFDWSSTASTYESGTAATAYNLTFIKTEVNPSYNLFARFYGLPSAT